MKPSRSMLLKALLLLALAGILMAIEFSPLRGRFNPDLLQRVVTEAGLMGPAVFFVICALGTFLLVPGTVFVGAGTAIFGPLLCFVCVWPGIVAGAALSYVAARKLGRDLIYSLAGGRLMRYDDLMERNGFKAVLLLRLMFLPLGPVSYGAGLTKVRFWDYFLATALGEAVTILAITLFIGELREAWISGEGRRLFSTGAVFSFLLLMALVVIAGLLKRKYTRKAEKSEG